MAKQGKIIGKEQLILLPVQSQVFELTTDPPGQVQMQTGIHAIVASGLIGVNPEGDGLGGFFSAQEDDDIVSSWDLHQTVGPHWRSLQQVSAMVATAGILSADADEVDHSRWVVSDCTWDEVSTDEGKRIRLKIKLQVQGFGNGWVALSYQVVATGNLMRLPTPSEISAKLD